MPTHNPSTRNRVLIVTFDGLRPDMVDPAIMPNLTAFAERGVRMAGSRAVFPTETRVNQASLVTGCWPERHGIVANVFRDPDAGLDGLTNSGDDDDLLALMGALDGKLVDVPVLGEILADHDRTLAVVGSGTAGGTRILHHRAEALDGFRLSLYRPDRSVPPTRIDAVLDQIGVIPEETIPALDRLTYATDVYLDYVEPMLRPDVCILWFFEPDLVYHYKGVGTPDSVAALTHADRQFGRVLERWQGDPELQIVTLSDHGHVTMAGEPIDVLEALCAAGFRAGRAFADDIDMVVNLSRVGGITVRDGDPGLRNGVVDWLHAQPWVGPVLTRDHRDTLHFDDFRIGHRRVPDVVFSTTSDHGDNEFGWPGLAISGAARLPAGAGNHGGLHRAELHNWFAAGGSAFRAGHVDQAPCGIPDVLPTVLDVLGLPVPETVQGRVLAAALADVDLFDADCAERMLTDGLGRHRVSVSDVGGRRYINGEVVY